MDSLQIAVFTDLFQFDIMPCVSMHWSAHLCGFDTVFERYYEGRNTENAEGLKARKTVG